MGLKEDIIDIKKEVKDVKEAKEHSLAMEIIDGQKKANERKDKRSFIIIMTLIILLFAETIYMFHKFSKFNSVEETIKVKDVNKVDHSNFNIGK
jgi:hypothetical protein